MGLLDAREEIGAALPDTHELPLVRVVVDDALQQLVGEGVLVRLRRFELLTELRLLAAAAFPHVAGCLVQLVGEERSEVRRDVDVVDRRPELLDDVGLREAHELVVGAAAVGAAVVDERAPARLLVHLGGDATPALVARHPPAERRFVLSARAVRSLLAERGLELGPFRLREHRLVLAGVVLAAPVERPDVERVGEHALHVAGVHSLAPLSGGEPQTIVDDVLANGTEAEAVAHAQVAHAMEERAPAGVLLDRPAAVLHAAVDVHVALVAVARRWPRRIPAGGGLRVLPLTRATRERAAVALGDEGRDLGLHPIALVAVDGEHPAVVGDVQNDLVAADERFEDLVVGEVARRAVPDEEDDVPNVVGAQPLDGGVELLARLRVLR